MNQSHLRCATCPGADRCLIAEAEACLSELCREKIRKEVTDIRWMLSLGDDGLETKDQLAMSSLLSKLQRLLLTDSPAEVFSAAREIARARLLQNGLQ